MGSVLLTIVGMGLTSIMISWLLLGSLNAQETTTTTLTMYNSISKLMGEEKYPEEMWQERVECFDKLSPDLNALLEKAWEGMIEYWEARGAEDDPWLSCEEDERWFEHNCTTQPGIEMDIWEPCNYASNLAYDRMVVEMCMQHSWTLPQQTVNTVGKSFAILTFASGFYHGSETLLGERQDGMSNALFAYVIYQGAVDNIPYDPIIHDLALSPRNMSAAEIVELWLDMYNLPVEEWFHAADHFNVMPTLQRSFAGIFGYILAVITDLETAIAAATPFMDLLGMSLEDKQFFLEDFLPLLDKVTENVSVSALEKAEILENTAGTVLKLMYAFVWQEATLDLGDIILTPEANAFGAALLPQVNSFANNLTSWDLYVGDIQEGHGYPGYEECNNVIPHAKWHVQAAASLVDVTRLL